MPGLNLHRAGFERVPLFSDSTLERIRAVPLIEVAGSVVSLRRVGSRFIGLCPFHSERHASFGISPTKNLWFCFGCNMGGDTIRFIQEIEHCDFPTAVHILANRFDIPMEHGAVDLQRLAWRQELREVNARIHELQRREEIRIANVLDEYRKEVRAYEHPDDMDANIYDRLRRADVMYVLAVLADEEDRLSFLSSSSAEQERQIDLVLMDGCFSKWKTPIDPNL